MSEITTTSLREVTVRALHCDTCRREYIPEKQPDSGWHGVPTPDGWYRLLHVESQDFHEYSDYCSLTCLATWACNKTMEPH